jgi:hypothetical protein
MNPVAHFRLTIVREYIGVIKRDVSCVDLVWLLPLDGLR